MGSIEALFDWQTLETVLLAFKAWVFENVLVLSNLGQLATIAAAFLAARKAEPKLLGFISKQSDRPALAKHYKAIEAQIGQLVFPLTWLIILWLTIVVSASAVWPHYLITITASLLTAWIVIRLTANLVRDPVWSKFVAITAWSIAALNIVNLLDPAIIFLDSMAVTLGELRISALTLIKGGLSLAVLLWLATLASRLLEQRIKASSNLTPSVKVLFSKFLKIFLIAIAVLVGLSSVGIDLTAFAVFGGAVGVGIGFGLQKVVSNLISGLLLLMDKSVKPGDVIAIGASYGYINSLGARYVSVMTRDGTEHLIPNEELITQRVENWSHTNKLLRLKIDIGISYDSDLHKAMDLCLDAASEIGRVLKTPKPVCQLKDFGESSLNLELRIWVEDPQNGVSNIRSDIRLKIWDAFCENGIRFPFPQRDIHIKTAAPAAASLDAPGSDG